LMTTAPRQLSGRAIWPIVMLPLVVILTVLLFAVQGDAASAIDTGESFTFNHQKHLSAGIQCVFCHPGTLNGAVAGIPSVRKCIGCHKNIEVTSTAGQANVDILLQHWEEQIPLRWEKVNDQPDFVRFAHRPHIVAGVNCESCHGNVREMQVMRPAYRINMGFCLNCHRKQAPETQDLLVNCVTCHR